MSIPTPTPNPSPPPNNNTFSFSHLSTWARAGLVIACLVAAIFILSTVVLCIVRRGRLIGGASVRSSGSDRTTRASNQSRDGSAALSAQGKEGYRKPQLEKEFAHSSTREMVYDEESRYESPRMSGVGNEAVGVRLPDEVALHEYGHGYGHGQQGQQQGHGYGYGRVQVEADADGYGYRHAREDREQRSWNAV